jgi:bifunctional non-homologous end joining protein LigD
VFLICAAKRAILPVLCRDPHYSDHQIGLGPAFYEKACPLGVEGIVSKRADAAYAPGNRGLWLKVKCLNREEFG